MGDLQFHNIIALQPEQLNSGTWLVILKPDRTPPHLALVAKGEWFSITYKGGEIGLPVAQRLGLLMKRRVAALCVSLAVDEPVDAAMIFRANAELGPNATCLDPIKQVLSAHTGLRCEDAASIHELLPQLRNAELTGITGSLNMGVGDSFTIAAYSRADILRAIEALQQPNLA